MVITTYLFIGILFYISFPLQKSCIEDVSNCYIICVTVNVDYLMFDLKSFEWYIYIFSNFAEPHEQFSCWPSRGYRSSDTTSSSASSHISSHMLHISHPNSHPIRRGRDDVCNSGRKRLGCNNLYILCSFYAKYWNHHQIYRGILWVYYDIPSSMLLWVGASQVWK